MKCDKTTNTSLIITEMLKAYGDECIQQIHDLIEHVIHSGKIPTELEESIIAPLYESKGIARKFLKPQIARPGHEGSREDGRELPKTTSAHK